MNRMIMWSEVTFRPMPRAPIAHHWHNKPRESPEIFLLKADRQSVIDKVSPARMVESGIPSRADFKGP
jgi:hypothetical protein